MFVVTICCAPGVFIYIVAGRLLVTAVRLIYYTYACYAQATFPFVYSHGLRPDAHGIPRTRWSVDCRWLVTGCYVTVVAHGYIGLPRRCAVTLYVVTFTLDVAGR